MNSNRICIGVWALLFVGACSPSIVEPIRGGAGTGCDAASAGCGGHVQGVGGDAGVPGGYGNGGSEISGAGDGPTVAGRGGTGGAGAVCVAALDEVAATWGHCPPTLCAGMVWAESCDELQPYAQTSVGTCAGLTVITLELGTHGKACYYEQARATGKEPKLVGAAAWDDTPHYCDETSFRIEAGTTPAACGAHTKPGEIVCDGSAAPNNASAGAGGEAGHESGDTPPAAGPPACFNALSSSCEPCCVTPTPDCTGKPNGYPGYRCTPEPDSFCSCACTSEAWSCGC